jgi:tetratricopeptide (TPR) repeat protein
MAADQFRAQLAETPQLASAHAMLALALVNDKQVPAAYQAAAEAIRVAPMYAFAHYAMAHVLLRYSPRTGRGWPRLRVSRWLRASEIRDRALAARAAGLEAIRLDPLAADYFELLASIESTLRHWKPALAAAEQGLANNLGHVGCANQRAHILNHLGRSDDAREQVDRTLSLDPEHATTHRRRGWLLLQAGRHEEARRHFQDALRLNPNDADAKRGLSNARAARIAPLRWFTQFGLWSNLAVNRPALVVVCVIAGVTFGLYRDLLGVDRFLAGAIVTAQSAILMLLWWIAAFRLKRSRERRARRVGTAAAPSVSSASST